MQPPNNATPENILGLLAHMMPPAVEPVDGACFCGGRVFRVGTREVFVTRRWTRIQGTDWCVIDLAAPQTGYVESRDMVQGVKLVKGKDGQKAPLSYDDEEFLYQHFTQLIESGKALAARLGRPCDPKVEIVRLYPAYMEEAPCACAIAG